MNDLAKLEKQVLKLPPRDREQIALAVWQSLENGPALDPEGIEIAIRRDQEIESGAVRPIDHSEFLRRTGEG
jgi:hypothetical protein